MIFSEITKQRSSLPNGLITINCQLFLVYLWVVLKNGCLLCVDFRYTHLLRKYHKCSLFFNHFMVNKSNLSLFNQMTSCFNFLFFAHNFFQTKFFIGRESKAFLDVLLRIQWMTNKKENVILFGFQGEYHTISFWISYRHVSSFPRLSTHF